MKSEKRPFSKPFTHAPADYKHLRYISAELSQCGKRSHVRKQPGMKPCTRCGNYHEEVE